MEHEKHSSSNKSNWGGAREGAGRKKGSINKISAKELLETAERVIGKPFVESLMEGYLETILDGDRRHRTVYEKMIVDKVASNLFDVEVTEDEDIVEARRAAFAAAIAAAMPTPPTSQDD